MALSNIRVEPRREIIESVIGIVSFVLIILADYKIAHWINPAFDSDGELPPWPVGMIIIPFIGLAFLFLLGIFLFVTHSIGESICKLMGRLDPRPKQRYKEQRFYNPKTNTYETQIVEV